jgi:hypothetical protein
MPHHIFYSPEPPPRRRDRGQRGAALVVALIAVVALLGIGVVTMLSVTSDTAAGGHDRFQQVALYAAESGVNAGMDYLRHNCDSANGGFFSNLVEPNNVNPQVPSGLYGNNVQPGQPANPFNGSSAQTWYKVTILNNTDDSGFAAGNDNDGLVVLHSEGHGPGDTVVTLEALVSSPACIATFCASGFAQERQNANNDAFAAVCTSGAVAPGGRVVAP